MKMKSELSVIIPTLNERNNIAPLVEGLRSVLKDIVWDAIFVDDHSTDGTAVTIEDLCREDERIHLLKRSGCRGLSSACIEGMKQSSAPYIAVIDADLQHDENLLTDMLNVLKSENLDIVIGSRYVHNAIIEPWSRTRLIMSQMATVVARGTLRLDIKDPLSGYFMVTREFFGNTLSALCGRGQKILLDLCLSSPSPVRFRELPYRFKKRASGKSKLNLRVIWENICLVIDKRFKLRSG